jgi:fructokinase
MKVLSFGEILWDIIEGNAHLGGAPLNFAAHSAQCGAESYMISRLGSDDYSKRAMDKLDEVGVNHSIVQMDDQHPTGTVEVFLQDGQPSYTIHTQVAYDYIDFEQLPDTFHSTDYDIFYFGTLAQRGSKSRESLYRILQEKSFQSRFYDVNFRKDCFSKNIVLKSLEYSDVLKLNDEEVAIISEYMFSRAYGIEDFMRGCYEKYGHKVIIVTAGAEGCYIHHDNNVDFVSGKKVVVADAVGAGDSFSAAFMYVYYHTLNPLNAAKIGNQIGGYVASQRGAIPKYSDEIKEILSRFN